RGTEPVYSSGKSFRVSAWSLPPNPGVGFGEFQNNPNYATEENYRTMAECGFNTCMPITDWNDTFTLNTLTQAQATGMKVLVQDSAANGITAIIRKGGTYEEAKARFAENTEALKARYDEFKKFTSFAGVNAYDEPATTLYEAIRAGQDWFRENYPEYEYYVNLLPNYATPKQLFDTDADKNWNYEIHVSKFAEEVKPAMLSYDHYCLVETFDGGKEILDDFYYNLYVFAEQGKKHGLPVYIYLQTMAYDDRVPLESYADFAWQTYTSLAFGVQGIQCFCYWTMLSTGSRIRQAIVDRDGSKTQNWDYVSTVLSEIKSFEDVYFAFEWDGFKLYEKEEGGNVMFDFIRNNQLSELKGVKDAETNEDIIAGQFLDAEGYPAYMIANASSPFEQKTATVTLTFDSSVTKATVYRRGEKRTVDVKNNRLTLELASGEGDFVIPY
ncbi:MAG: hypothetical protein K2H43_02655, partial [Clostridia bacterium]|nr:hypothetical protein [Clostridia bacterium]